MWTIAAVNKKFDGPLGSYNGLTDVHLAHFFSRPSRQSHLKAAKLITEDGFIVPEKNVKVQLYLDEKKRKVYDFLARSILQNAVHKEGSWNKKLCNYLEDISKMAAVDKARRTFKKKSSKVASELFFEPPISSHLSFENSVPRSASKPLNIYRNNLKPPNSAPGPCFCFANDDQHKVKSLKRSLSAKMLSPYGVPLVLSGSYKEQIQSLFNCNGSTKQKKKKQRKFNVTIGNTNAVEKKNLSQSQILSVCIPHQTLKFSQCKITMLYHGHLLLTNFQKTLNQNIIVKQQHCGGTPVVIYKGRISANDFLSFFSLDHEGFFFSITVFLNGIRELKLSSCCVFRYLPGRRLGGPNGTFSIKEIEGGKPCLKCQYQEYEINGFKDISQASESSVVSSTNKENSPIAMIDIEENTAHKTPFDTYEPEENHGKSLGVHNESLKITNIENNADEVEEILDDLPNQGMKEEISSEENIVDEINVSSSEEEIKEQEESSNSVSSMNQSEVSEKYIEEEPKNYTASVGSSSSEYEGENQHIVTVSIHETPENN